MVICPSNPLLSIEPVLAVAGMREAIAGCAAPVIAVSPIIGGRAVKGPTAKMMAELGIPVSAIAVARRTPLARRLCSRSRRCRGSRALDIPVAAAKTLMVTLADREALACEVLAHADALAEADA